jgi:hypothetical protein
MVYIVEMCAGEPETPSFRYFECHGKTWEALLELGRRYGWQPAGTVPDRLSAEPWARFGDFPADYKCEEAQYAKFVTASDADALATALEAALRRLRSDELPGTAVSQVVLIRDDMTETELRRANAGLNWETLVRFVEFLRQGGFSFFWDD